MVDPTPIPVGMVKFFRNPKSPESASGSLFSLAMLPKGHQLVVRGVVPALNETPTAAIKNLLANLGSDPRYKDFADFGIDVQPFSDRVSNISSVCYVEISSCGEAKPRVDLLEIVMDVIVEVKPEVEVRWSKKGKSDNACHAVSSTFIRVSLIARRFHLTISLSLKLISKKRVTKLQASSRRSGVLRSLSSYPPTLIASWPYNS